MQQFQGPVVLNVIQNLLIGILLAPETPAPETSATMQMIWLQSGIPRLYNVIV
jgi:hypothetical protein